MFCLSAFFLNFSHWMEACSLLSWSFSSCWTRWTHLCLLLPFHPFIKWTSVDMELLGRWNMVCVSDSGPSLFTCIYFPQLDVVESCNDSIRIDVLVRKIKLLSMHSQDSSLRKTETILAPHPLFSSPFLIRLSLLVIVPFWSVFA